MGRLQIVLLLHASENHPLRHWPRNHIGILLSVAEIHHVALVSVVENILASFLETFLILHITEELAPYPGSIDKNTGLGEHLVQLLEGFNALANKVATQGDDLFFEIWHVQRGVGDQGVVRPSSVEVGGKFTRLQFTELPIA